MYTGKSSGKGDPKARRELKNFAAEDSDVAAERKAVHEGRKNQDPIVIVFVFVDVVGVVVVVGVVDVVAIVVGGGVVVVAIVVVVGVVDVVVIVVVVAIVVDVVAIVGVVGVVAIVAIVVGVGVVDVVAIVWHMCAYAVWTEHLYIQHLDRSR